MRSRTYRTCLRCDVLYLVGEYRLHQKGCAKTRPGRMYPQKVTRAEVLDLLATGLTQTEIARRVGVTRQRIGQLVKEAA